MPEGVLSGDNRVCDTLLGGFVTPYLPCGDLMSLDSLSRKWEGLISNVDTLSLTLERMGSERSQKREKIL